MAFHATISFTRYYLSRLQGVSLSLSLLSEAQKKFFSSRFRLCPAGRTKKKGAYLSSMIREVMFIFQVAFSMEFMMPLVNYIWMLVKFMKQKSLHNVFNCSFTAACCSKPSKIVLQQIRIALHQKNYQNLYNDCLNHFYFRTRTYSIKSKSASVCSFCHHLFQNKPADSRNSS